jgi:vacuolar-type H+-ATPase subunit E/Vma4
MIIIYLAICGIVLSGCGGGSKRTIGRRQAPKKGQISKVELRDELDRFEHLLVSQMQQTAEEIDAVDGTRRTRRTNARMQARLIEALHAMTGSDDSIIAFLDTWALLMRIELYYKGGPGRSVHGDQQHLVIEFIDKALENIERIGHLFLGDKELEELKRGVYRFAVQHPIDGTYSNLVVFATQEKEEEVGVLMKTLSIPMAPIRAMEGVDNTATAILRVRDSVEHFTNVAQQMPESTRWQMSILIDDFEEAEMTQSFLESLNDFSRSSTRLVEVLDTMPEQMRSELLTVLEESDESQQQLQETMQTVIEASDRIEKMFTQLDTTSQTLNVTTQQASDAAIAWQAASDSIQDLVGMFKGKPRDPNAPPGFGMRDFDNMLLNAGQTADKVGAAVAQIQQTVDATEMQGQLRSLFDHVMWRLFELVLAVAILVFGGRVLVKKLQDVAAKKNQ